MAAGIRFEAAVAVVALVVATAVVGKAAAATYTVGDSMGWTIPSGGAATYAAWAAQHTFVVGDILVFNFTTGAHDVARVDKGGFDSCSSNNPISMATVGPANKPLSRTGEAYFICTFGQHCSLGQKLAINVSSSSSSSPPPAQAPQTPALPPTPSTPTPTAPPTSTPMPTPPVPPTTMAPSPTPTAPQAPTPMTPAATPTAAPTPTPMTPAATPTAAPTPTPMGPASTPTPFSSLPPAPSLPGGAAPLGPPGAPSPTLGPAARSPATSLPPPSSAPTAATSSAILAILASMAVGIIY